MMVFHLIAISLAYIIDRIIGDPPDWPHPVRWIGSLISVFEKRLNSGRFKKIKGVIMLLFILLFVFSIVLIIILIAFKIHVAVGVIVESIIIASTIAQKSLKEASIEVYRPLKNGDISLARKKLSYIVGRDTDCLDESEIARGAIETVAENTSDGVTAPLFWALIGGAPLAMVYRAANTCDSMVGHLDHRYKDFGWASAKWDDVLNWIPSRITGILMILGTKPKRMDYRRAWKVIFRDAKKHPSPNSGWGEAAVAAILGIQLGGKNYYKGILSDRARMGEPLVPIQAEHILMTNSILSRTVLWFLVFLWLGGTIVEWTFTYYY